ncbi:hypothetical protein CL689_03355, partial [Candidatus Saccharibacteria bacterium]|nr:hypothetical protein [Candidatus Saccharibacteria bacterium]
ARSWCDSEEQGRKVYFSERDDDISEDIPRAPAKEKKLNVEAQLFSLLVTHCIESRKFLI